MDDRVNMLLDEVAVMMRPLYSCRDDPAWCLSVVRMFLRDLMGQGARHTLITTHVYHVMRHHFTSRQEMVDVLSFALALMEGED